MSARGSSTLQADTLGLSFELERLTNRLDDVDHEIVQLLATTSDDLHAVTSKQAANLAGFMQQVSETVSSSQALLANLADGELPAYAERIKKRLTERQNLKSLWRCCEERRLELLDGQHAQAATASTSSINMTNLSDVSLGGQ